MEIIFSLLALFLHLSASQSHYNITTYVSTIPPELRHSAARALTVERFSERGWLNDRTCRPRAAGEGSPCPPAKYRRPDGECNNIVHPGWGSRGQPFLRLIEPVYSDGKSQPRLSTSTHSLPSPLAVSAALQRQPRPQHKHVTALLGAWGEFLLQDLAATSNPGTERCCGQLSSHMAHPECYSRLGDGECKEYMRSLPALSEECNFKYRDQMNLVSSFLDGSAIYGSTDSTMEQLRTYDAGLVNISACAACATNALYSALLREHNRLAVNLHQLNSHWSDEVLFLEAKRVVAAEIQHITYNEFLTTVLGEETVHHTDLQLQTREHYSDYSSSHRAGIFNEVALSALPAFLSMVPDALMKKTRDSFAEMVDKLIATPAYRPSMHMDVPLRQDWETAPLLIHMARDHGIADYTSWLKLCNPVVNETGKHLTFKDLNQYGISDKGVQILRSLYSNPSDIDLLTGALLETPTLGSLVGPTFNCLLRHQFSLLRRSDRFWYENDLPPSSLTTEQLQEIRKVTLAGLLCANTDGVDKIQPMAFIIEDPYLNARITCDQHILPQLTPWLEVNHMTDLSDEILMDAISKAEMDVLQRRKMEYESWATFGGVDPKSPGGTAASFSKANKQALKLANSSLLFEFASNEIINALTNKRRKRQLFENSDLFSVSYLRNELTNGLQGVDISSMISSSIPSDFDPSCEDTGPCDSSSPFRTLTGYCNNLRNPSLGKSLTTFARLLPSSYEDGISKPRISSVTGVPLPNPRVISTLIHPDISNLHTRYTLMVMQFAQFLDHDLTMTPVHKGFHESIPNCRSCDSPRTVHQECNPFPIPPGDHYYPEVNVSSGERFCFPFMRSLPGQQSLGPREQVNQNTAFLDASQVYGENGCVARDLKGIGGRMNSTIRPPHKGKELLPQSPSHPECKAPSGYCFIAGDGRASEQPALTVIHTIFLREHNRIVEGLRGVNPHWDAEKLFEHARRIIVATNQHITYNEFLPRLLSWNAVNLYGLKLLPQGYYKDYNPTCNPSIVTEFASAAFRIGHSLLRPHIPRLSPTYQVIDPPILLRDGFFKPDMLMQVQMIDEIARGLVSTPMEALDQFITGEVTNHLFEDRRIPFSGIDLIAMNIQRARDHGIQSYNNYRALCNLKRATAFEDLAREIPPEVIARLKKIYPTVDDIDLFPGGMSERPLQGGLIGPTFACIMAIQFRQLRKCDRFWYENEDPTVRFTPAQLSELRKITLAKVICENLDISSDMQKSVFDLPSNYLNPRVSCQSLPQIDLSAWRESTSQGCIISDRHVGLLESAFPTPCTSCICTAEGAQCASLRVTDCSQLLREWSREAILRDDVCTAQCGYLLRDSPTISPLRAGSARSAINTDLIPPPASSRHVKARQLNNNFNGFNGFKLPDLTPFIG